MKRLVVASVGLAAFLSGAARADVSAASAAERTFALTCESPAVSLAPQTDGSVVPVPDGGAWMLGLDAPGAPAVPRRTYLFAAPDGMSFASLGCDVVWETLAAGVRLAPQPEPVRDGESAPATPADPVAYGAELHPAAAAAAGGASTLDGVTVVPVTVAPLRWSPRTGLLEKARSIVLSVTFTNASGAVSRPYSGAHCERVKAAVANPEAVAATSGRTAGTSGTGRTTGTLRTAAARGLAALPTQSLQTTDTKLQATDTKLQTASSVPTEPGLYRTDPETNAFEYLLISPPDFFDDWCWYVRQRRDAHANLRFAVKNTAAVYAAHPFPTDAVRNAAESIHAYLRQAVSNGVQYVVLGGAWLDAQNLNGYTPYFVSGEAMTLSNCVPGVYGFPRENWRQIPADLFYGCLDMKAGQKYPWDLNGDGKYIDQADCQNNDTYPDVCVSRITLNPHNPRSGAYNQHVLITNYVAKLRRGEDRLFGGHYRYGMSVASTGSSKLRKTGDRMYYRELEFYDDMYNMFDPRHHDSLEDGEYSTRVRYYDQFSNWRPIRSVKGMMNYTWTETQPTLAAAMDDYYAGDRDFGYVQAHGWAQGAAQFSAYRFAMATGLTLFNGGSGPCETGYPDYHVSSGGKKVLQYNVGDAAVTNPDGGALASVNNSRWSWAGGGGGFAAMSYYMLNEMLVGFNGERLDVGHAWLKGVRNYWPAGRWGNTAGWVLSEQFLYGDPLVRLPELPNVWWTGGETGVWDRVTANWTNNVDGATTFDAASNVYFTVQSNLNLNVAGEIAAMRLSLPALQEEAVITLAGTGTLRVMQAVDVAGTNATLRFDVAGGVGHDGIRFVTGAGDLVFVGTNRFYVGGVKNAKKIALLGGGVTLDVDEFPAGEFPLEIDGGGRGATRPAIPNVLRSKNAGGLKRFGTLAITNSHVKLSTVDAFGNGAPMTHALVDSELEVAANVYYQRSGFPEGLNATFLVDGDSSVTSSEGGLWTVKHTTTFVLGAGAAAQPESAPCRETHLTLSADTVDAGGKIVITNALADSQQPSTLYPLPSNTVTIASSSSLSGDVTVGAGIRLVLKELPLSSVTSLTIGEGATVELPDDASGYWQIVPVSSKFTCADDVAFVLTSDPTNRLAGASSKTGSFFREGALYAWTGREGDWNTFFANRHPKVLFGDIEGVSVVTVRVAAAVSPEFAFFSNLRTKYVFEAAADDASVLFSSVYFCGPTEFNVPVAATEYADVSAATSCFANIATPYVHVAAGAGLALAGSHWTDLRLDAGAVLVAMPGETLDWNADTTLSLQDDGAVLIDVSSLDLDSQPQPLVTGNGHAWTLSDLTNFRLVQTNAELRIEDGALCAVRGDNLKGPYELCRVGEMNWNCAAWTATNAAVAGRRALPKAWGECALDWAADAAVWATNATLVADCDVHLQTLTIHAGTNDFSLAASTSASTSTLNLSVLDLTDCHGTTDIGVDLGDAAILTESSTNGADVVRLRGTGSGTIDLEGITMILDRPGGWSLTLGAQGVLKVLAPQAYERFRVAKVPDGFKDSALTVKVLDAEGNEIDGFQTSVSDGALWCVPPALEALVPPGTNDLSLLEWRDVLGNAVSNVDWNSSAGFKLIGTETSGVVVAKSGFESVWSRLSVSNEVVLYGNETFAPTQIPGGSGVLALAGAFTLTANVRAHPTLLAGSRLKLLEESTLEISHGGANFDATAQDWSGIAGTGRVRFTDAKSTWLALPGSLFADTLSVETASDLVLTPNITEGHPFAVANLSGAGTFRTDWGNGDRRPVRTVQTGVSDYAGTLSAKAGSRDTWLNVASDAPAATTNKALILSGAAVAPHALNIETNGCVILTGSWQGTISVAGLLVITNASATNGVTVKIVGEGKVREIAPEEVPSATAAGAYVAPTYPEDPDEPETPVAADERVRILAANVAAVGGATALPWTGLDWRDTNGVAVADVDWSAVTNVTLTATNGIAGQQAEDSKPVRVVFDAEGFSGLVRLGRAASPLAAASADLSLEVRKTCPFTLAADSAGTIDFRLDPEPTATCDLIEVETDNSAALSTLYSLLSSNLTVTVRNRYGRAIAAAGEVAFDAAAGKYYLNVQAVDRPTYSCTFDTGYEDTITSPLWFSGSGNLTYKARPEFFVGSRAGRALKGTAMNSFAMHSHNGNPTVGMDNVNVWSFNFVVKLPTNNGGIVFAWGNKDNGNGVAFARVREDVAGVYAWENGGAVRLVASARVPFASTQFHDYAITFDGGTLGFYVDGALARAAALVGKYPSRGFYQWFKMYGQNGGLSNGPTTEIDDFRLYVGTCLTPTSVARIADGFPPWPEHPSAVVDVADLAWSNLYWSADCASDAALSLEAGAGNLLLDAPVAVTNALAVGGGSVPVRFVGDGVLSVSGGLSVASSLDLDASGLDGTNLASYAVANVPYSRWLVRGAYSGTVAVTALPDVPEGYAVRVESFASLGVRLVFTAPRYALADAVGLSVGDDAFGDLAQNLGLHPTSPTNWYAYATWTNEATAVGGLTVVGSEGGKVDSQFPYGEGASVARYFVHTSFDGDSDEYNGKTNGLSVTGLKARFGRYRVLVYLATDTSGANFGPVTIAGRTYVGVAAGSETESATLSLPSTLYPLPSTLSSWGKSKVTAATEGVNVVVSDVLEDDAVSVFAQRLKNGSTYARAQIAALEIVRVGEIHEFTGSRYSAEVTGTTAWNGGDGEGLAHHPDWRNGAFSSICLTAAVANATLAFDTAVTAETFRVVSAAGETLTLARTADMAVYGYDFSASEGTVRIEDDICFCGADGAPSILAASPRGTLDIMVADVTSGRRLFKLASDFDCAETNCTYLVHDADGNRPDESWTVLPVDGWLVFQRFDAAKPWYSLTFENALDTCVADSRAVALRVDNEGTPSYADARGGAKALTGATPYSKDEMDAVPAAWTIHAVAEMPKESNGILFGYGKQGQRGVGLLTVDANTVAVAWWDSRGKFTVINAAVTNATCQFHAYALVSTGARVALYVDGACRGDVAAAVNPQTPVIQIGSVYGGSVSGMTKTQTGVLDDWRLYDGVLSANAIRTLASGFPPWPDYRTATLAAAGTAWDDLEWNGAADAGRPLLLDSRGGSLAVTNACELTNALYATGQPLVLVSSGDGFLASDQGLTLLAGWTIDCSGLDATNLMARADRQSPYVHWLVRGAYSGGDPTVTGVPEMSARHSLVVVADAAKGVWLEVSVRADFVADLTNATAWTDGAGAGLDVKSVPWANDVSSTITLTQRVDAATLDFDTAVTGRLFRVVSTNGQALTLCASACAAAIAAYDFSSAAGTVSISNDIPSGTTVDLGPTTVFAGAMNGTFGSAPVGATVRYAQEGATVAAARLKAGVTNTFASAVVNGDVYGNPRTYLVGDGDALTIRPSAGSYDNYRFAGTVVVEGGRLLFDSQNQRDRLWFGVCGASSFTQTGGEVVANARSDATAGSTCFTIGNTGSGNIPFVIAGGTFTVAEAPVCFWQHESLSFAVSGTGVAKVKGLYANGTKGVVTVRDGGVLSVGAAGIAANLKSLTLAGGTLTAHADATTAMAITLGGDATVAADDGVVHTIAGALAGGGTLTVGAPDRTGTVRFADAAAFTRDIVLAHGTLDVGTNRLSRAISRTGGKIQVRLTVAEEQAFAEAALLPVSAGTTNTDYVVLGSGGIAVEPEWVSIRDGRLVVDTSGMNFSKYEMPLRGTMAPGRAWAEQTWYESSAASNRVPAVYWGSARGVTAVVDIASNAVVSAVPACVTNLTVMGEGTIVSEGKWPTFGGLTNDAWRGTLRIAGKTDCTGQAGGCTFDGLGNGNSTVEMDGVAGWFDGYAALGTAFLGREHPYALKIGAGGFTMNNGNSGQGYAFARLTGSGAFTVGKGAAGSGPTFRVVAREAASFVGTIGIVGNAGVTLGTPVANAGDGRIAVAPGATANVTAGANWSTVGGFDVASGATLNILAAGDPPPDRLTVTTGALTLPSDARLTFGGGGDVRAVWCVAGGDLVRADEWCGTVSVSTNYAANAIVLTGATALALTNAGSVTVEGVLDATAAKLTIDAGGLDAEAVAKYAVAGAPHAHWLVRGAVKGTVEVANLPALPATYGVRAEVVATDGVRLVVTANRAARFGAISVNVAGNGRNVADGETDHGAHPVAGSGWNNFRPNTTAKMTTVRVTAADGTVTNRTDVSYLNHRAKEYDTQRGETLPILYGYHDDGEPSEFSFEGIPFDQYRLIVYYATDSTDYGFAYMAAGATSASAKNYCGAAFPSAAGGLTRKGTDNWGSSNVRTSLAEGVNYLVTDVLTGGTAYVKASRRTSDDKGRATIAAIQVVKVGEVYEGAPEYDEKCLATKLGYVLPGTAVTQTFDCVYHPLAADGAWGTPANWATAEVWQRKDGSVETNYTAYAGTKSPYVSGAYVPVAIVARDVVTDALDGWNERVGLFGGATLTVRSQTKFQSDANTKMFVAVDATSRYTVEAWGNASFDHAVDFYIAAPSGFVAKAAYGKGAAFNYHLVGDGSVCFEKGVTATHAVRSATIELGDARWTDRKVARKYLVIGSGTATTAGATVAGGVQEKTGSAVTEDDAVGTYRIASDATGTFIEWVAYARPEVLEVHPSETDETIPMTATNAVKIVCCVTNGAVETRVDLTSAFRLVTTNGGVRASLNPHGSVRVLMTGSAMGEEIPVKPELATIDDDDHVADTPFALTDAGAAVGVKAIPGLVYRLMRADTPAGVSAAGAHEAASVRAGGTRLKLTDPNRPAGAAFYLIRVDVRP